MKEKLLAPEQALKEENPFEDPEVAKLWITSVEDETGGAREKYIYPLLRGWLQDPFIQNVLDIGAGQGVASPIAVGKKYVGVEPSKVLVERAKEKYPDAGEFVLGDAYHLPFPANSFDAVFSINVWFHLEKLEAAAKEMARILRPGGKFLLINPNPDAYATWKSFYEDVEVEGKKFSGKAHIPLVTLPKNTFYMHSDAEVVSSLEQTGCHISESADFAPMNMDSDIRLFKYYSGKITKHNL